MLNRAGLKLFRAGSYVLIVLALVHSISLFSEPMATNPTETAMFKLMKTYTSDVMGSPRTMWQFFYGFNVSFTVLMLAVGGLNLIVSRVVDWHVLRSLAFFNVCWLTAMTLTSIVYFFIAPTAFFVAADVLFLLAWWKAGKT
jgi:hypothetical protein